MINSTAEKYKRGAVYTKEDKERRRILGKLPREKHTGTKLSRINGI